MVNFVGMVMKEDLSDILRRMNKGNGLSRNFKKLVSILERMDEYCKIITATEGDGYGGGDEFYRSSFGDLVEQFGADNGLVVEILRHYSHYPGTCVRGEVRKAVEKYAIKL